MFPSGIEIPCFGNAPEGGGGGGGGGVTGSSLSATASANALMFGDVSLIAFARV